MEEIKIENEIINEPINDNSFRATKRGKETLEIERKIRFAKDGMRAFSTRQQRKEQFLEDLEKLKKFTEMSFYLEDKDKEKYLSEISSLISQC